MNGGSELPRDRFVRAVESCGHGCALLTKIGRAMGISLKRPAMFVPRPSSGGLRVPKPRHAADVPAFGKSAARLTTIANARVKIRVLRRGTCFASEMSWKPILVVRSPGLP